MIHYIKRSAEIIYQKKVGSTRKKLQQITKFIIIIYYNYYKLSNDQHIFLKTSLYQALFKYNKYTMVPSKTSLYNYIESLY